MPENARIDANTVYKRRRDRLRKLLIPRGIDAILVSQPANRFYLSGFELHDPQPNESSGYVVVCADGADWLATDSRYALAAEKIWPADRIDIYSGSAPFSLNLLLARLGSIVGIESKGISLEFARKLEDQAKRRFCPAFVPADGLVESLRIIKDESEIAALKASFHLNHAMLAWLEKRIGAGEIFGLSEKQLAWEIEKFFRESGAQELAFSSIVAIGEDAALPHAVPGETHIAPGAPLLADVGCRVDNYCSDQTRTWWLGDDPSQKFIDAMRLVRAAQEAAISMMRPGVKCADVYATARQVFVDAGVENAFTHGLGHGVGLETHEAPSLSSRSAGILKKGMVVTVEPGLYYKEWGGIRHENTVLVVDNGVEIL